jgi:hypothetical protein
VRLHLLTLLAALVLLSACTFYDSREFQIARGTPRDDTKVRQILREIASQAQLPDRTHQVHIDHSYPLAAYMNTNVQLEAHDSRGDIKIELSRSDWPPPRAFKKAERLLAPALSSTFGHRLQRLPLPGEATAQRIIVIY